MGSRRGTGHSPGGNIPGLRASEDKGPTSLSPDTDQQGGNIAGSDLQDRPVRPEVLRNASPPPAPRRPIAAESLARQCGQANLCRTAKG